MAGGYEYPGHWKILVDYNFYDPDFPHETTRHFHTDTKCDKYYTDEDVPVYKLCNPGGSMNIKVKYEAP